MKALKNFQIEAIHRKLSFGLVLFGGIVLIAGLSIIAKFADIQFLNSKIEHKNSQSKNKIVTVSGSLACLPLKDSASETKDCELGVKSSDGYYAVSGSGLQSVYGEAGGAGIEISGELIPAGPQEKHDIIGTVVQ